jgi:ligand-binding SRPBCC domain-containing protein
MMNIHLTNFIAAPVERVFDLSRSIDLHKRSMSSYDERPTGGRTSGLIKEGEEVEWTARHLFKIRKLKTRISSMQSPYSFTDVLVSGDFKSMRHEHIFKPCDNGTIMIDLFQFDVPYGIIGRLLANAYLGGYMKNLLEERNKMIKQTAEGNNWTVYLNE